MVMCDHLNAAHTQTELPKTIQEAVILLTQKMPLKDRGRMAKMAQEDQIDLHFTLGIWIRNNFGLWSGNNSLKAECIRYHGESFVHIDEDEASMIIIYELWKHLNQTHRMRIIKGKK